MVVQTCHPNTWKAETGGSWVQVSVQFLILESEKNTLRFSIKVPTKALVCDTIKHLKKRKPEMRVHWGVLCSKTTKQNCLGKDFLRFSHKGTQRQLLQLWSKRCQATCRTWPQHPCGAGYAGMWNAKDYETWRLHQVSRDGSNRRRQVDKLRGVEFCGTYCGH